MNGGSLSKNSDLILFYADWCGHCQQFKPIWKEIKEKNLNINYIEYNDEINANKINEFGVQGFPTIILKKGDNLIRFEEERTSNKLIEFINKHI